MNTSSRFYDHRIGQSVTLTGRCITRHMISEINQILTGKYDHQGDAIIYGDSVSGDTLIKTPIGDIPIDELFESCSDKWLNRDKEFASDKSVKVLNYNPNTEAAEFSEIEYICKHNTNKEKYCIEDENNNKIIITGDHSIMVERDGRLIEVKPNEILEDDLLIIIGD